MIRRFAPAILALLFLLGPAPRPGAAGDDSIVGMEHFLPPTAHLYLSLPSGKTATEILDRLGRKPGRLAEVLRLADGPVTFSRHSIRLPGRPPVDDAVLVSFSRKGDRDELRAAAVAWVLAALVPGGKPVEERIGRVPVQRYRGKDRDVFVAAADRYVLVATDAFVLGRVLRRLSGKSGKSLVDRPEFAEARALRARRGGALLWGTKAALPRALRGLGVARFAGVSDKMVVVPEKDGRLSRLTGTGAVPVAWSGAEPDGVWIGASLTPRGVLETALAVLDREHLLEAMGIDGIAAGPMEFLWRPGRRSAVAFRVREGADAQRVLGPMGDRAAVRSDGAIVASEDLSAWRDRMKVDAPPGPERKGGARLTAPVSTLLGLLGRDDVKVGRRTTWVVRPGDGKVTVTSGPSEVGPVEIAVGALVP